MVKIFLLVLVQAGCTTSTFKYVVATWIMELWEAEGGLAMTPLGPSPG